LQKKNSVTDENILGAGSTEILDFVAKFVSLDKEIM
jgi:histidinol-phosphate aminotransferase